MNKVYVFDTGVFIPLAFHLNRNPTLAAYWRKIGRSKLYVSVVTLGELRALALKRGWGERKTQTLNELLGRFIAYPVLRSDKLLMETYARLDAYSENKLPEHPLGRSVTMGKNDLWIAATAAVLDAELVTFDSDFAHLGLEWLSVRWF